MVVWEGIWWCGMPCGGVKGNPVCGRRRGGVGGDVAVWKAT